jgi:hypothetical protein
MQDTLIPDIRPRSNCQQADVNWVPEYLADQLFHILSRRLTQETKSMVNQ